MGEPSPLPGLSQAKVGRLQAKAQKYAKRLVYLEDRAAAVRAGTAATTQKDRNAKDVQIRLNSIARNYRKDFRRYRETMEKIYGPAWADFDEWQPPPGQLA